jgi:hypothetical protein
MKRLAAAAAVLALLASGRVTGQLLYTSGQNVVPVFEGWERNADGSFNLLFGYFNRNRAEVVDVPVGPANRFEPGETDRGQPTRFYPSRNRYWFRVRVPADFGSKELVWTLTVRGRTERAYATLNPNYVSGPSIQQLDVAGINLWWAEDGVNKAPVVRLEGEPRRRVKVGQPLPLAATVSDDGIPPPPKNRSGRSAYAWYGLRVAWVVDRGAGQVTFDPPQFKVHPDSTDSPWAPGWLAPPIPPGGVYRAAATFGAPGEYVVRLLAHDGGLATTADLKVLVD